MWQQQARGSGQSVCGVYVCFLVYSATTAEAWRREAFRHAE